MTDEPKRRAPQFGGDRDGGLGRERLDQRGRERRGRRVPGSGFLGRRRGDHPVDLLGHERVPVELGRRNESRVEVLAGLEAGGDDVLQKPVQPEALLRHVAARLQRSRHEGCRGGNVQNLAGVPGYHTLQVQVIDETGKVLESSETSTFHMLRFAGG